MSTDSRVDAVMRSLTARERALAELRSHVAGEEPDPELRRAAPYGQVQEMDTFLDRFVVLRANSWSLLAIGQPWLCETDIQVGWLCCAAPLLKRLEALEQAARKHGLKLLADVGTRPSKGAVMLPPLPETADWVVAEGVTQLYGTRVASPFDGPVPFRKMLTSFRHDIPEGLSLRRSEMAIIEQVHTEVSSKHYEGEPIMAPEIRRAIDEGRARVDYLRSRASEWIGPFEFRGPTEERVEGLRASLVGELPAPG